MPQALTITRSKLLITPITDDVNLTKRQEKNTSNLIRTNEYNGFLSQRTKVKLERTVEGFCHALEGLKQKNKKLYYSQKRMPTFVTLTLSYQQFSTDNEIKRKCLTPFLQHAIQKWGVVNYLWRAEPQENGRIHFHILFDKFIDWRKIRNVWNHMQNRLEYIDAFQQMFGHRDPNSTDVHSLRKVHNIAAYVCKYMSKRSGYRKIEGRIWGCSKDLHNFKAPRIQICSEIMQEIIQLKKLKKIFEKSYEYCSVLKISRHSISEIGKSRIQAIYNHYVHYFLTYKYLSYGTKCQI